jgi:hypothetical protein
VRETWVDAAGEKEAYYERGAERRLLKVVVPASAAVDGAPLLSSDGGASEADAGGVADEETKTNCRERKQGQKDPQFDMISSFPSFLRPEDKPVEGTNSLVGDVSLPTSLENPLSVRKHDVIRPEQEDQLHALPSTGRMSRPSWDGPWVLQVWVG